MAEIGSRRGPVIAVAIAAGVALGAGLGIALTDPTSVSAPTTVPTPSSLTAPDPSSTTVSSLTTAPPSATSPSPTTGSPEATTASTLVAPLPTTPAARAASQDPAQVVRNFLDAYLSWRWDDVPTPAAAVRARARPWDTDRFDAQLGQASGAGAVTAERIAAHEVDTVEVVNVDEIEPTTPTSRTYLALAIVTVTKDGQQPPRRPIYLEVTTVRETTGWYVDKVVI